MGVFLPFRWKIKTCQNRLTFFFWYIIVLTGGKIPNKHNKKQKGYTMATVKTLNVKHFLNSLDKTVRNKTLANEVMPVFNSFVAGKVKISGADKVIKQLLASNDKDKVCIGQVMETIVSGKDYAEQAIDLYKFFYPALLFAAGHQVDTKKLKSFVQNLPFKDLGVWKESDGSMGFKLNLLKMYAPHAGIVDEEYKQLEKAIRAFEPKFIKFNQATLALEAVNADIAKNQQRIADIARNLGLNK